MSSIDKLKKALLSPEYYELEITQAILTGCDKRAIEAILSNSVEQNNSVYLLLQKFYSVEVGTDELLEVSESQQKAADSLSRIAMAIAEKETQESIDRGENVALVSKVEEVERKIKEAIDNNLTLSSLPLEWMSYFLPLNNCVARIISGDSDRKAVDFVLSNRVNSDIDWDSLELGSNFVREVTNKFIRSEQAGWVDDSENNNSESLGESSLREEMESLKNQITELTGLVSSLTSDRGVYTQETITINSPKLQHV